MEITARLQDLLIRAQNADGGWGYLPAKASRVEPTCWAILGLAAYPQFVRFDAALDWLVARQRPDGNFVSQERMPESNWNTAHAALALAGAPGAAHKKAFVSAITALTLQQARTIKKKSSLRPELPGWGWTTGSFSWVEPTALALIALRQMGAPQSPQVAQRVRDGLDILKARRCADGGWNYGNTGNSDYALGAFPVPTAMALVALCLHESEPAETLRSGFATLTALAAREPSLLALGWTLLTAKCLGMDIAPSEQALRERAKSATAPNNMDCGLALLALAEKPRILTRA
jgi:hypothetical protein